MEKNIFINDYISRLIKILEKVDISPIEAIITLLDKMDNSGNTIYIIGNGGSAATSSHMANDFGTGLKRRNLKNLNVVSLADNTSVVTAIGNDIGFENIFYMQIKDVIRAEDVLLVISCSGNSPNLIKAVQYAKTFGTKIVSLTGFDGGKLMELSDINYHVPTEFGEYGLCEDMHMIFDHIIYSYFTRDEK